MGEAAGFAGVAGTLTGVGGALAMRTGAALVGLPGLASLTGLIGFAGALATGGVFFIGNSSTHRGNRYHVGTV